MNKSCFSISLFLLVLFLTKVSRANNDFTFTNQVIESKYEGEEYDTLYILEYLTEKYFENYTVQGYQVGDINRDKIEDIVLVIERQCTEEDNKIIEAQCRKVVFLVNKGFRTEVPRFRIAATNDKMIDCSYCGGGGVGNPHQGITIKNGYISFESLYGACYKTFTVTTFKYESLKKDWFLHKIGIESYSCRPEDNEEDEINVTTDISTKDNFGIIRFSDYSYE